MEGWGFVFFASFLLLHPSFLSLPSPTFPINRESPAFFRMGLVQSPGPFAGRSWAGAERLMAVLESCQLSLMNVDFCCWPLKSVLLWSRNNAEAKGRDLPWPLHQEGLGTSWNVYYANLGKGCFRKYCLIFWQHLSLPPNFKEQQI